VTATVPASAGSGAVYDRGYRPYDGPRGGRTATRAALFRMSLRRAMGLRRSWRQKVAPFVLLGVAVIPAVVNVGVKYLTRNTRVQDISFFDYREYIGISNTLLVFVALTAPDLFCPDRRQRVLPLYFARPMTGIDYVAAKAGAMFFLLFSFSFIPQVILFVGQMLVSKDGSLTYFKDNVDILWKVPVAVLLFSLYYALLSSALASLTARRITAGASIVGLLLVANIVAGSITGDPESFAFEGHPAALIDLWSLPMILRDLVFQGHVDDDFALSGVTHGGLAAVLLYAAVIVASVTTLLVRYDQVER
jgi:ABC-2 type transport system permease protein